MIEISTDWVTGVMVGIEFPPSRQIDEDMKWSMIVSLGILRIAIVVWDKEE